MPTIPASRFVSVTPSVLAAGGDALDTVGLMLTTSARVPIGTVPSFPDAPSVAAYFGPSSAEAALASGYFAGYDNSQTKPAALLFAQYNTASVPAYLRGANVSALTLAQLQAISGSLSVTIDGVLKSSSPNLAAATSFSNAASILGNSLGIAGTQAAVVTGAISGTTLTVSAVTSGTLAVGDVLSGTGVTAGTYITALGTGTGGTGTYTVSASQTAGSTTITASNPGVTYDPILGAFIVWSGTTGPTSTITFASGAISTSLGLTAATGAALSQGAAAATPAAFMTALIGVTMDWVSFMTTFDPDNSGNANKLLFAQWNALQNDRFAYVVWDNDATPRSSNNATASLGQLFAAADTNGSILISATAADGLGPNYAAFVMGAIASVDYTQRNGRTSLAYRAQAGLVADVTDATTAANLEANGYNYYGAVATANDQFTFLYPGSVSGSWDWIDSYVNQIVLSNAFQLALMVLLTNIRQIPYTQAGNGLIEAALQTPINDALSFGTIRAGVELSAQQAADINAAAGRKIDNVLSTRGWYLLVGVASPTVRAVRGSPPLTFWYTDGQSVQRISINSVTVE